jgi:hypothetical protein
MPSCLIAPVWSPRQIFFKHISAAIIRLETAQLFVSEGAVPGRRESELKAAEGAIGTCVRGIRFHSPDWEQAKAVARAAKE